MTLPTAAAIAGPMSGAMTIDPTTVAGESSRSPAVAITAETTVMIIYVGSAEASSSARASSSCLAIRSSLGSVSAYASVSASKRSELTVSASRTIVYASRSIPLSRSDSKTGSTAFVGTGKDATAVYSRPLVSSVTT